MRKMQAAIPAIKPVLATRKRKKPTPRELQGQNSPVTNTDLAVALSLNGLNVGLLETDIHKSKFPRW
jgi:Mrp family chromosome partitioning ATPase